MIIEFDPDKSEKNRVERALPFSKAADFDWKAPFITKMIEKIIPSNG